MLFAILARWVVVGSMIVIATAAPSAAQDKVADLKELAGTYSGYAVGDRGFRADNLTMTIKEDGSWASSSPRVGTQANSGQITLGADGTMQFTSLRNSGTVTKKGNTLRFDGAGSRGSGYSEWERAK